jgi:hypothetical protein
MAFGGRSEVRMAKCEWRSPSESRELAWVSSTFDICHSTLACPSCHEKRALEKAGWVAEHVCAEVPHRQFVFTIPKRLRIYFRFERRLLGDLCRAAARTVMTVYRAASGRTDAAPGMVGATCLPAGRSRRLGN